MQTQHFFAIFAFLAYIAITTKELISTTNITDLQNINSDSDIINWRFLNWCGTNSPIYNCGGTNILGGPGNMGMFTEISKNYSIINPHYAINISMDIYYQDHWDGDDWLKIYLDGVLSYEDCPNTSSIQNGHLSNTVGASQKCGRADYWDINKRISIQINHNTNNLEFKGTFICTDPVAIISCPSPMPSAADGETWGLNNIIIIIYNCYTGCSQCHGGDYNQCTGCSEGYYLINGECKVKVDNMVR